MEMRAMVERLILEAYWRKTRVTVKAGEWFYEGKVIQIYENKIIKFSIEEGNKLKTGFFLISDIEAILEET